MKQMIRVGLIVLACFGLTAAAQDWYHDRDARYRGEHWRGRVFEHVRMDLDHIGSAVWASGRERDRLERTKQQLSELQGKLENGRYDKDELDDVIASLNKSSNDDRLAPRDREVLRDDVSRLRQYRERHDHWNH